MQARVHESSTLKVITACSGINFVKTEWYDVPVGREQEALNNPYLEVRLETPSSMDLGQVDQVSENLTGAEGVQPAPPVQTPKTRAKASVKKAGAK